MYYISSILVYVSIPYFLWTWLTHDLIGLLQPSIAGDLRRSHPTPTYPNLDNGAMPHTTSDSAIDLLHPRRPLAPPPVVKSDQVVP
jgi:hypothetical protein